MASDTRVYRVSWMKYRSNSSSHGHVPLQCLSGGRLLVSGLSVSPVLLDAQSRPSFQPAFTSGSCRQELQDQTTPFLHSESQVTVVNECRYDKEARILPVKVPDIFLVATAEFRFRRLPCTDPATCSHCTLCPSINPCSIPLFQMIQLCRPSERGELPLRRLCRPIGKAPARPTPSAGRRGQALRLSGRARRSTP